MGFKVTIAPSAEKDISAFLDYLLLEKKNYQAAKAVFDDYEETIMSLTELAGSLRMCEEPELKARGYYRILFKKHRYYLLYRMDELNVYVEAVLHELQDPIKKMI